MARVQSFCKRSVTEWSGVEQIYVYIYLYIDMYIIYIIYIIYIYYIYILDVYIYT